MQTDDINGGGSRPERARGLRASDADRAATAELLRRHYADGRLDTQELEERIDRCYAAKMLGDLPELVADLPRDEPPEVRRDHWRSSPGRGRRLAIFASILVALAVVSVLTGAPVVWLAWPVAFFVLGPFGYWFRRGRRRRGMGRTYVLSR